MSIVTVDELLESGIHFGHSTSHWNPKMKPYIHGKKNGIYLINIRETVKGLIKAYHLVQYISAHNGQVLFVGTKKQAKEAIKVAAKSCGMPYVDQKWLGGALTNLTVVRSRISRFKELDEMMQNPAELESLPTRKQANLRREHKKLKRNLEGIVNMEKLPDAIVVIDTGYEKIAMHEANSCNIPVIALCDTNGDPDGAKIPIPGNDDAIRSIAIVVDKLAAAINEGAKHRAVAAEKAASDKKVEEKTAEASVEKTEEVVEAK